MPAFGGKGMYGDAVHEAVVATGAKESGITIHYVDEQYDHGRIFFQASFNLSPDETAEIWRKKYTNWNINIFRNRLPAGWNANYR